MKKIFLFSALLFFASQIKAQVNLVPNPSFEDTINCSTPTSWTSYGNSPDYYNPCEASSFYGIPINNAGYQYAANGNAYLGLFSYLTLTSNQREFIGAQLVSPLTQNTKYFVSLKVNLADFSNVSTNNIGILFTKTAYNDTDIAPIHNHAQIYSHAVISDTAHWVKVSGTFIADSAYQYIVVGNFFDDSHTNTSILTPSGTGAYYLIDGLVCFIRFSNL